MDVTVVIPTLNAGEYASRQIAAIGSQTVSAQLVVIDSSSGDGTAELFESAGAYVKVIDRHEFHHAATRNLGASLARSEFVAFLTQDAIPADNHWLERLLGPLASGHASAAYSRQLARPDASPMERFARSTNYPAKSRFITQEDVIRTGARGQFFSNSASAVRRSVLEAAGWFPTGTVQNEDMLLAATLLRQGHTVAYVAESRVIHSHSLSPMQVLRRYFDIGTVLVDAADLLAVDGLQSQGAAYVRDLMRFLVSEGLWGHLPAATAESAAKAIGLYLGRNYRRLPKQSVPRLSSNAQYWKARLSEVRLP